MWKTRTWNPGFSSSPGEGSEGEYLPGERALSRAPILSLPNATTILNTASRVVVIPYPTIVIFLVHMCDFAAVMSRNINTDPQ